MNANRDKGTSAPLRTQKGSVIRRHASGVGKVMGKQVYVHKRYMFDVVPVAVLNDVLGKLPKGTVYNAVVYDWDEKTVRFDEALNFDSDREPCAGSFLKVWVGGGVVPGHTDSIWHHKWMWVKDDYRGFDVRASYEWSRTWLAKLKGVASGSMKVWQRQLAEAGL